MAIYIGGDPIDKAQAIQERHAVSSATGRCLTCGTPGPCRDHELATRLFARSLRLPRGPVRFMLDQLIRLSFHTFVRTKLRANGIVALTLLCEAV